MSIVVGQLQLGSRRGVGSDRKLNRRFLARVTLRLSLIAELVFQCNNVVLGPLTWLVQQALTGDGLSC